MTEVIPYNCDETALLKTAAAMETMSAHPLAQAITAYVKEKSITDIPQLEDFENLSGQGLKALFDGKILLAGNQRLLEEHDVDASPLLGEAERLSAQGQTPMFFAADGKLLGLISVADPVKDTSAAAIQKMKKQGIGVVLLTGDNRAAAEHIGSLVGVDEVIAEVLPEDKANYVMQLKKRGTVMMVGDGINDAPALAFAHVGTTLGSRQTDLAAETSAVTIRSEDPTRLIEALQLGRRTMGLIHQNFTATITVNSAAMLLGALGVITPLWAAIIHNTATLAVVLNSARILAPAQKKLLR